jgi:hypothetical protein
MPPNKNQGGYTDGQIARQQDDLISLLLLFQNKASRLEMNAYLIIIHTPYALSGINKFCGSGQLEITL